MKCRIDGKEKLLALGVYPEVGLKEEARRRRDDARKILDNGGDPASVKKTQKAVRIERAENTFKAVALEWFESKSPYGLRVTLTRYWPCWKTTPSKSWVIYLWQRLQRR